MTDKTGLDLLRAPFPAHHISKLPKPTKAQTDEVKADFKKGVRCEICGGWHHPKVVHLDYVGHAALTDRLLEADSNWSWEPVEWVNGHPAFDSNGGMWIKLTVCGVTRLGYGDAQGKAGGDAVKECIGDALRNAAMRFGAALDLWHKGDLHIDEVEAKPAKIVENGSAMDTCKMDLESLTQEGQEAIKFCADCAKKHFSEGGIERACDYLDSLKLSNEENSAMWYLFDSKLRTAIKAETNKRKVK